MHGQSDTDEADDRRFFVEAVNKSIHDAMLNHNTTFLNTFHNTMKEMFHGFPLDQVGPAYYNIPHPSTQGTNQAGTCNNPKIHTPKIPTTKNFSSKPHVMMSDICRS